MKKYLAVAFATVLLVGAGFFIANAEEEPELVHVSQIEADVLEAAGVIDCVCITGPGLPQMDKENMQPDKNGMVYVNSNGFPICEPCENEHQEEDPGN